MIATRIEDSLRRRFYGLFWKRLDPLAAEVWKMKLVQCIEKNLRSCGTRYFMPDRYLVSISPETVLSDLEKQRLVQEMRSFIFSYQDEYQYRIADSITIDIIMKNRGFKESVEFFGWRSGFGENDTQTINAVIYEITQNGNGMKFIELPVPGKYLIGKAENAEIQLDHNYISQSHALLLADGDGEVKIKDLCSLNGTYIQGARMEQHKLYTLDLPVTVIFGGVYHMAIRKNSGLTGRIL